VARVDYALANFPGSGLDAEALVLKGETLLKMHKPKEARAVFEKVIADHGGPFWRGAKRGREMMAEKRGGAEPASSRDADPRARRDPGCGSSSRAVPATAKMSS